jgi:HAE1 family hydrophobic/amphiphilic exporter-1
MQWLAEICVKRPVFATVLILSLVVVGIFAFTRLGVDRYPKVDLPTILVTTVQQGAAPEQIETEVTDKSRMPSTRSAASTSCARRRPKACRR